jgi:hypothetical protein
MILGQFKVSSIFEIRKNHQLKIIILVERFHLKKLLLNNKKHKVKSFSLKQNLEILFI